MDRVSSARVLTFSSQPDVPAGDVIFHIRIKHHPTLTRNGATPSDLFMGVTITLSEALLGFDRILLVHLDGRGIRVVSRRGERVIQHQDVWVVRGEGMPRRRLGTRGDLYIRFKVEMPGVSWAVRQGDGGVELPPPPPELETKPEVVDTRYLSAEPTERR